MTVRTQQLVDQCGTVKVKTAPLLMLIGAVISCSNAPDIDTVIDMLDPVVIDMLDPVREAT